MLRASRTVLTVLILAVTSLALPAAAQEFPDYLRLNLQLREPGAPKLASSRMNLRIDIVDEVDNVLFSEDHCGVVNDGDDGRVSLLLGEPAPFSLPFDELYWASIEGCQDNRGCGGITDPAACLPEDQFSIRVLLDPFAWAYMARDSQRLGGRLADELLTIDTFFEGDASGYFDDLQLGEGVVTTREILDETITAEDIATGAVTSSEILDGSVGTDELADGAVTSAKIGPMQVRSEDLAASSVTRPKIARNAVTNREIADGAVGASKVARGQVQLRVTGTCPTGESIREVRQDGTVVCAPAPTSSGGNAVHGMREFTNAFGRPFIVPAGVHTLWIELVGGGGGGGAAGGGAPGGGGGQTVHQVVDTEPGRRLWVEPGWGGPGATDRGKSGVDGDKSLVFWNGAMQACAGPGSGGLVFSSDVIHGWSFSCSGSDRTCTDAAVTAGRCLRRWSAPRPSDDDEEPGVPTPIDFAPAHAGNGRYGSEQHGQGGWGDGHRGFPGQPGRVIIRW